MFEIKKHYGILGIARSGVAAAQKIRELGGEVFLSDIQEAARVAGSAELMGHYECEFGGHTARLLECDELIVSPGIPLSIPIVREALKKGIKLISEIEFAYQIKAADSKIIAVTGSNGKSTTASLIHHILSRIGKASILAGNIGDAFSGYPIHKPGIEYIVLEISSFQLDLIETFKPDVSVLLNITPDHLNRYESFGHYVASKFRILENQTEQDFAILNLDDDCIRKQLSQVKAMKSFFTETSRKEQANAWMEDVFITFDDDTQLSIYDLSIKGPHNHTNAMAAILAADALIQDRPRIIKATTGFEPLSHRLEYVSTINGVAFYNDSKATNTDSVKYALQSFDKPIRIIMGGSDKGEDFSVLTESLSANAVKVYICGETADKMRQAWLGKVLLVCLPTLKDCVRQAFEESLSGDNIVLSPACASYDQFRNFEHRGESFKAMVKELRLEYEKN